MLIPARSDRRPALGPPLRKRDELGLAGDLREALSEPVVLGGADPLARAGDEVPRHEAVAERLAADEDDPAAARRRQRRRRPGAQDDHRALVVLHAVDLDRVVERVERALARVCRRQRDGRAAGHVEIERPPPASATRSRPASVAPNAVPTTTWAVAPARRTLRNALGAEHAGTTAPSLRAPRATRPRAAGRGCGARGRPAPWACARNGRCRARPTSS